MAYTTLSEVRALDSLVGESSTYTDGMITDGIAWATQVIDGYTGVKWEATSKTVVLDGNNAGEIFTGVPHLRSVTSCTVDGVAQTTTAWVVTEDGMVRRDEGVFSYTHPGRNVSITVSYGVEATCPVDIAWACRTLARWYVIQLLSERPDNALNVVNEWGTVVLAQPGGKHGPTALPEVNAVLKRRRVRPPIFL